MRSPSWDGGAATSRRERNASASTLGLGLGKNKCRPMHTEKNNVDENRQRDVTHTVTSR